MTNKIQRLRRLGALAIGVVKRIFHTGRAWGSTRTRIATARRPAPTVSSGAALGAGALGGAAGAYFLDPQNGERRREAALGRLTALRRNGSQPQADAGPEPTTAEAAAGAD
jgi:hypothetical protein